MTKHYNAEAYLNFEIGLSGQSIEEVSEPIR